jgi:predicted protein tyrosine phosphatase
VNRLERVSDLENQAKKLLFVCGQNIQRSLTAEVVYDDFPRYAVKSAGTEASARTPLTPEHVQWADMVFVMEAEHLTKLQGRFGNLLSGKKVVCLNIPDIYCCMEPALIEELKEKLSQQVEVPG